MAQALTQKYVVTLTLPAGKSEHVEWDDEIVGLGFRLRRSRTGGVLRSWIFRYARPGGDRKVKLGDFPAFGAGPAHKRAGEFYARTRLGEDPAEDKQAARAQAEQTMGAILKLYLPRKRAVVKPSSYREFERHLMQDAKKLHSLPLAEITPARLAATLLPIAERASGTTFNNVRRSVHAFFVWCMKQGLIDRNPVIALELHKERSRERVLSADELRAIWRATAGGSDYEVIVRLLMLTGARANEIARLRWNEVREDRIDIAGERTKNGRPLIVSLLGPIRALIDSRERREGKDFVFGRLRGGPFAGWGESKRALDERLRTAGHEISDWRHHDLRRSAATALGELGVDPWVIEALLNHAGGRRGVAGTYNRSKLDRQVRDALALWIEHLMGIVEGRVRGDQVVPLRRRP